MLFADDATVFLWCIQTQLLLQIVINRIRVIVANRQLSRQIMILTAVFVTIVNISVVVLWIPARLQVSHKYVTVLWPHMNQRVANYVPSSFELTKYAAGS